jgi:hypothetical protein
MRRGAGTRLDSRRRRHFGHTEADRERPSVRPSTTVGRMTMTPEERRAKDAARKRRQRAADREALGLPPRPPALSPQERRQRDAERKRAGRAQDQATLTAERAAWLAEVKATEEATGRPYWWPDPTANDPATER